MQKGKVIVNYAKIKESCTGLNLEMANSKQKQFDNNFTLKRLDIIKGQVNISDSPMLKLQNINLSLNNVLPIDTNNMYGDVSVENVILYDQVLQNISMQIVGPKNEEQKYYFNNIKGNLPNHGALESNGALDLRSKILEHHGQVKDLNFKHFLNSLGFVSTIDAQVDCKWHMYVPLWQNGNFFSKIYGNVTLNAQSIFLQNGIALPRNTLINSIIFKEFENFIANIQIKNGIANLNEAYLSGDAVLVQGSGRIGFLNKRLDVQIKIERNAKVLPIHIDGTFDEPMYHIDPNWLAKSLITLPVTLPIDIIKKGVRLGRKIKDNLNEF